MSSLRHPGCHQLKTVGGAGPPSSQGGPQPCTLCPLRKTEPLDVLSAAPHGLGEALPGGERAELAERAGGEGPQEAGLRQRQLEDGVQQLQVAEGAAREL